MYICMYVYVYVYVCVYIYIYTYISLCMFMSMFCKKNTNTYVDIHICSFTHPHKRDLCSKRCTISVSTYHAGQLQGRFVRPSGNASE